MSLKTRSIATIPGLDGYVEHAVEVHVRETPGGQDDPALYCPVWPTAPVGRPRGLAPRQEADLRWVGLAAMAASTAISGLIGYQLGSVLGWW